MSAVTTRDPEVAALLPEAQRTMRRVARTFATAARLLPRGVREDTELLYLVLRTLDDLVDLEQAGSADADARLAAAEAWAGGFSPTPTRETRILDDLVRGHPSLPRDAIADFVRGMRQDLAGPRIETEVDLDVYAYRVAGTVGRLMAALLGAEGPEADRAARELGIAMQRTNVIRDVDEDLARGRIYLPAETLAAHGMDAATLGTADRHALLRDEIARADALYDAAIPGISLLRHGRRSIRAAAVMYREILRQVERDGLGERRPWRAVVPRHRKAVLLAGVVLWRGAGR
jgi:phytoene synthase